MLLTIEDTVFKKTGSKKYAFVSLGPINFKIVLALLTKVVVFYVQITIRRFKVLGLERFVRMVMACSMIWCLLDINLYQQFEQYIDRDRTWNGRGLKA